ncbi:MAG: T9SS type A sorting domain-containing protein [Fibrobacteres bacterium]|nr:T9SS type A sorting domain-containing protein [Fibrobacterota bacterium]
MTYRTEKRLFIIFLVILSFCLQSNASDWLPTSNNTTWHYVKFDSSFTTYACQLNDTGIYCPPNTKVTDIEFKIDSLSIIQNIEWKKYRLFQSDPAFVRKDNLGNVYLYTESGSELWFKKDFVVGDTWSVAFTGVTKRNTVSKEEKLTVSAGSFDCVKITSLYYNTLSKLLTRQNTWWSDSIGPVRMEIVKLKKDSSVYALAGAVINNKVIGKIAVEREPKQLSTALNLQLYPNPSKSAVVISFDLNTQTDASLKIYNSRGQCLETISNPGKKIGRNIIYYDSGKMSNGLYVCKLQTDSKTITKQFLILK